MALPDGLHVAEPFKLPCKLYLSNTYLFYDTNFFFFLYLVSDAFNSANVEGYQKYLPEAIPDAKARLAEALERYNFD